MESVIQELRTALEMSQGEFGKTIGVTAGRVCQVEKGDGNFSTTTLLRVARRYRVELTRLGYGIEDLLRGARSAA